MHQLNQKQMHSQDREKERVAGTRDGAMSITSHWACELFFGHKVTLVQVKFRAAPDHASQDIASS